VETLRPFKDVHWEGETRKKLKVDEQMSFPPNIQKPLMIRQRLKGTARAKWNGPENWQKVTMKIAKLLPKARMTILLEMKADSRQTSVFEGAKTTTVYSRYQSTSIGVSSSLLEISLQLQKLVSLAIRI
jgi:IS30 family transposase